MGKPDPGSGEGVFKPIIRTLVSNPARPAGLSLDAIYSIMFHILFYIICPTFYFADQQRAKDPSSELLLMSTCLASCFGFAEV
jgi:hypothetical protein